MVLGLWGLSLRLCYTNAADRGFTATIFVLATIKQDSILMADFEIAYRAPKSGAGASGNPISHQ